MPFLVRSSVTMVLTIQDNLFLVFHEERFRPSVSSPYLRYDKDIFQYLRSKLSTTRVGIHLLWCTHIWVHMLHICPVWGFLDNHLNGMSDQRKYHLDLFANCKWKKMLVKTLWYQFSLNDLVHANGTLCKYLRKRNWSLNWQDCVTGLSYLYCCWNVRRRQFYNHRQHGFLEWINSYIDIELLNSIENPCPNFKGGLVKLRLKTEHGWSITSHENSWM